jgi:hypothetical protein
MTQKFTTLLSLVDCRTHNLSVKGLTVPEYESSNPKKGKASALPRDGGLLQRNPTSSLALAFMVGQWKSSYVVIVSAQNGVEHFYRTQPKFKAAHPSCLVCVASQSTLSRWKPEG